MARLLAIAIILFPLSFVRVDDRGVALSPIVIHLQKNSPAYAAFEDMMDDYAAPMEVFDRHNSLNLASGSKFIPKIQKWEREMIVALKPIRIQAPVEIAEKLNFDSETNANGELLPLSARKEQVLARFSALDLSSESPAQRAQDLVKESLANFEPARREFHVAGGGTVVIQKPPDSGFVSPPDQAAGHGNQSPAEDPQGTEIRAQASLVDGAVYLGPDSKWSIYRRDGNHIYESGQVLDPVEGRFAMRIREPRGDLVLELRDASGRVTGRGRTPIGNSREYVVNLRPAETPTSTVAAFVDGGESARAPSSTIVAFGDPLERYDRERKMDLNRFTPESNFFLEAFSPQSYSTVALSMRDGLGKVRLFSKSLARAFFSIVSSFVPDASDPKWSTLWGRVVQGGHPLSGARVEVAASGDVTYFNELSIPMKNLNKTTSSGEFAVVRVAPGVQSVRVEFNGRAYPARVVPSFGGRFTQVDLEVPTRYQRQAIRTVDLLKPDLSVASSMRILGMDDIYEILTNGAAYDFPQLEAGYTVEVDAGWGYELMRTHIPTLREPTEMELPLFQEHWVGELVAESKQVLDRRLGVVIGFTGDTDAEAELLNDSSQLHRTVYFDSQFHFVESSQAPAGGGFIKFNIPLGFQTVRVQPMHSAQAHVESFVSEPYFIYLVGSQRFIHTSGQENP